MRMCLHACIHILVDDVCSIFCSHVSGSWAATPARFVGSFTDAATATNPMPSSVSDIDARKKLFEMLNMDVFADDLAPTGNLEEALTRSSSSSSVSLEEVRVTLPVIEINWKQFSKEQITAALDDEIDYLLASSACAIDLASSTPDFNNNIDSAKFDHVISHLKVKSFAILYSYGIQSFCCVRLLSRRIICCRRRCRSQQLPCCRLLVKVFRSEVSQRPYRIVATFPCHCIQLRWTRSWLIPQLARLMRLQ
jgi:hypothetical protein